jgi:hypothetical protein
MPSGVDDLAPRSRSGLTALGVVGVIVLGALIYRFAASPPDAADGLAASASASAPLLPPRCVPLEAGASYRIGPEPNADVEPGANAKPSTSAPLVDEPPELDRDDLLSPYAVVVGRAVAFEGGYALGVLGDAEGGSVSSVATLSADGTTGKLIRLARSRGDLEPPVVAATPSGEIFAAMLEPNASSRALKLAKVVAGEVTWGAEITEGKDPSLAIDLAVSARRGVLAWDGLDGDRSFVSVAGFALDSFATMTSQRRATNKEVDADMPRVVARPGGFFLSYLVHERETERDAAADRGPREATPAPASSSKKKPKKGSDKPTSDDVDEARGGESVGSTWVEVVPLDESGAQASDALRITPAGATVTSFDVGVSSEGNLIVAYRDDDAPTGGVGGQVHVVKVHMGGFGPSYEPPDPLPSDGIPSVLDGWLGVPTLNGPDFLARLGADGLPSEPPQREVSLGIGEPIAARGDQLLLADPDGRAMKLRVVTCGPRIVAPPAPPADD